MKHLCSLHDISRSGAKEFQLTVDGQQQDIFVVYHHDDVYAYVNYCPHQGLTLNWVPDQFLNYDNTLIQCSNHDALFRIEDGVCISGACVGDQLTRVAVKVDDGQLFLTAEHDQVT